MVCIYGVVLINIRSAIYSRSTGTGKNVEALHNAVSAKQRHFRIWNNISLFHNCQNLKY